MVSGTFRHQAQHWSQAFFVIWPLRRQKKIQALYFLYTHGGKSTQTACYQSLILKCFCFSTLSILFSMKSRSTCRASMFFPSYSSSPPCTGTWIRTSKQDTGRLLRRFMAWLEEVNGHDNGWLLLQYCSDYTAIFFTTKSRIIGTLQEKKQKQPKKIIYIWNGLQIVDLHDL